MEKLFNTIEKLRCLSLSTEKILVDLAFSETKFRKFLIKLPSELYTKNTKRIKNINKIIKTHASLMGNEWETTPLNSFNIFSSVGFSCNSKLIIDIIPLILIF